MKGLLFLCIAFAIMLVGCATPGAEPVIRTVEVNKPVPVKCKPNIGPEPTYPDSDEALAHAADVFAGVQLLSAGRLLRIAREVELMAALRACEG